MLDRHYESEKAYAETFKWNFETGGRNRRWDDYIAFLENNRRVSLFGLMVRRDQENRLL